MISTESRIRLRPSVSMVPLADGEYQFFQGNTRRSRAFRLQTDLAEALKHLDGSQTIVEVAADLSLKPETLLRLANHFIEICLLEDMEVATRVSHTPWRRVLNFLADYIPSYEIEDAFKHLRRIRVVVFGVGAVGSWVAVQLAQSGVSRFTIIDEDIVEPSNLNRSLYTERDIGKRKIDALSQRLNEIDAQIDVQSVEMGISDAHELQTILVSHKDCGVVVNCADYPSVDVTSSIVDKACKVIGLPYVIAGGYNLHLSLIGMTVIPGKYACYNCGCITLAERQGNELDDMRKLVRPWRNIGNLAPLAAITASFAVNEVIRLAMPPHRLQPRMVNRRGEFNFLTNELHYTELPPRKECGCLNTTSY